MFLKELKLTNFKNCESADLQFSEKINCFVGCEIPRPPKQLPPSQNLVYQF